MSRNSNSHNNNSGSLGFSRKLVAVFLVICGILFLAGWFWQLRGVISYSPDYSEGNRQAEKGSCLGGDCAGEEADKKKDTDGDGLSDWEEKNIHQTSPYLKDTDGDGISDKEEIDKGTDPNCPEGKECGNSGDNIVSEEEEDIKAGERVQNTMFDRASSTEISSTSSSEQSFFEEQNISVDSVDQEDLKKVMEGGADERQLRQILIDAGMDEDMVEQVSDEKLMESYEQSLNNLNNVEQ